MDRIQLCRVLAWAAVLGAAPAGAVVPNTDCGHFDRGTEIIGNIASRFYQPNDEDTALVFKILLGMKKDAQDAKTLEEAALQALGGSEPDALPAPEAVEPEPANQEETRTARPTTRGRTATRSTGTPATKADSCGGRKTKLTALIGLLDEEIKAADAAIESCKVDIHKDGAAEKCHDLSTKVMDLDYKIGLDEEGATVAANDGELVKFMDSIGKDGCDVAGTWEVQLQVHSKIAPRPCARDGSYCYMTRIGKLREAREQLGQVKADPLSGVVKGVNSPLLHEAEHRFWYLRDHLETDNRKVLDGVLLLTKGLFALEDGLKNCPGD